jgi:hypothetical protein
MELLPPTIANLRSIEGFATAAEVTAWAATVTDVPRMLPVVLIREGELLILRPGDDGYEEALAEREASGEDPALVDAARSVWGPRPDPR